MRDYVGMARATWRGWFPARPRTRGTGQIASSNVVGGRGSTSVQSSNGVEVMTTAGGDVYVRGPRVRRVFVDGEQVR